MEPTAAVSGYPMAADFDYTFSDGELNEILGFLETQHQQPELLSPTPDSLALLEGKTGHAGLQFQPHSAESLGLQTPSHSGDSLTGELEVKREQPFVQSSQQPGLVPMSGNLPQYQPMAQPVQQQQASNHHSQSQPHSSSGVQQPSGRTISTIPPEPKGLSLFAAKARGAWSGAS